MRSDFSLKTCSAYLGTAASYTALHWILLGTVRARYSTVSSLSLVCAVILVEAIIESGGRYRI